MSIQSELEKRILLLDGAMGTLLPSFIPAKLKNLDEAVIEFPEVVERIHRDYSKAGADIIKTNTFNNSPYAVEATQLARNAIGNDNKFIAGVIGPVFYETKIEEIIEQFNHAKVDTILIETAISLKETLRKLEVISPRTDIPIMVSMTVSQIGNALSGEDPSEFLEALKDFNLLSFGFNCSFGTMSITEALKKLENPRHIPITAHPNHGLPSAPESDQHFLSAIESWVREKKVRMIGGCCGTNPTHIERMKKIINHYS